MTDVDEVPKGYDASQLTWILFIYLIGYQILSSNSIRENYNIIIHRKLQAQAYL